MIVCHCERVSDRTVRHAIAAGARTIDDITDRCGAGGSCGGCWTELAVLLSTGDRLPSRVPRWRRKLADHPAVAS